MEQTILTRDQLSVLRKLAEHNELASLFYLAGGTALAEYYFHHRYSDDLDFFTAAKEFPQLPVEKFVSDAARDLKARPEQSSSRSVLRPVRVCRLRMQSRRIRSSEEYLQSNV